MNFSKTKYRVKGRGNPPDAFLNELILWAKTAPDEIFAPNAEPGDIYNFLRPILGPWKGAPGTPERLLHRKAAMCELLRCLAGFESSWHWNEGVDTTNRTSMSHIEGQETGIFQVSFDSTILGDSAMLPFARENHIERPEFFIKAMKEDHRLALEYAARLLRISYQWDGPIKRGEINSSLYHPAVAEFESLLTT